jgi:hypothetical protein
VVFSASKIGSFPEGGIEKGTYFRVLWAFQPCIDGGLITLGQGFVFDHGPQCQRRPDIAILTIEIEWQPQHRLWLILH